jgi:predicted transcriptional regulator of viral defense system
LPPFRFLTNHGQVLLCIADDPTVRIREIASAVGITERAAQRIVSDLTEAGCVTRVREGRRNSYSVHLELPITLPNERDVDLHSLLDVLLPLSSSEAMVHRRADGVRAAAGQSA